MNTDIKKIIETLKIGGIIALPTDTVYGIVGDPTIEKAVNKVYDIKKRNKSKKLSIIVSNKIEIKNICKTNKIINSFIYNQLENNTIILDKKDINFLPLVSNKKIGIRTPNNEFIIKLLNRYKKPLFATSINVSGEKECLTYNEVLENFKDKIDIILPQNSDSSNIPSKIFIIENEKKIVRIR